MRLFLVTSLCLGLWAAASSVLAQAAGAFAPVPFDADWLFQRGGAQGAEAVGFDESRMQAVQVPHDWSQDNIPGTDSPYSAAAESQVNGGFTAGGTGWYRKHFRLTEAQRGKHVEVLFDGVYRNARVWLNGQQVGQQRYGYTSFRLDLTPHLRPDGDNVLAVKCTNLGENSRWYSGSGIYRHVWLEVDDEQRIAPWGVSVTTPTVTEQAATVEAVTEVISQGSTYEVHTQVLGPDGKLVVEQRNPATGLELQVKQTLQVPKPQRWSVEQPSLYTLVTRLSVAGEVVDEQRTAFGIRTIGVSVEGGFALNGKTLELKGGCIHHDNGPLGARALDRAEERKIELLKAAGFNALRLAHNPPSPYLLAVCDRLGMLVIDEAFDMWRVPKNPEDYSLDFDANWAHDLGTMVRRDRNHPSVIMWSIGNEVPERASAEGAATARELAGFVRALDPTRLVTTGVNGLSNDKDPFFAAVDVAGYNYESGGDHGRSDVFGYDHERLPARIMYQSESYPIEAFAAWQTALDKPYVLGDFVWTAWDYLGEASIGWLGYPQTAAFFPWNLAYNGDFDICGWKRPQSYYRDALWKADQVSVFVHAPTPSFPEVNAELASWSKWNWDDVVDHWTWPGQEGKTLRVEAYSSCEEVELLLDGRSLGRKPTGVAEAYRARFDVPYAAGKLEAVGYRGGKRVSSAQLQTAKAATGLKLTADRKVIEADGNDLSYVTVEITDAAGTRLPTADQQLSFALTGPGRIVAVGNADPRSLESSVGNQRKAWRGRALVIVQSTGEAGAIGLTATSPGLPPATLQLTTK